MKDIKRVYIVLTRKCTRRCSYCYEPACNDSVQENISVDKIMKFVNRYHMIDQLVFFGGEPLIRMDLIKEVSSRITNVKKMFVSTNGDLLSPEILKWLISHDISIQYSINDTSSIKYINPNILYHITLDGESTFKLVELRKNVPKGIRVWISVDRYIRDLNIIKDLVEIRESDLEVYKDILKMFRYIEDVGRNCNGAVGKAILYNPLNDTESRCADYNMNNYTVGSIYNECLNCDIDFCTACICRNDKSDESHINICTIYKFIKEEKRKYGI